MMKKEIEYGRTKCTMLLTHWGIKVFNTNDFNGSSSLTDNLVGNENVRYSLQVMSESLQLGERFT